ncbi:hypothetical protein QQ054_32195 [Oscillatoria amoena NRMC-F 0135]|nr:hypothetical protein [Oscillatoria amoena NRMC-F 0135]
MEAVWDDCRKIALQIAGYITLDFKNKIHNGTASITMCIEMGEVQGIPVSKAGDLFGWRLEFEFMVFETEAATYDSQYWNTPLDEFM